MAYKVAAATAGTAAIGYFIYTAQPVAPVHQTVHRVKVCELPVYQNPESRYRYEDVKEEVSSFRQGISGVRQVVWRYLDSTKETRDKVTEKWEISKAHTNNLIGILQDDPNILRNAGYISLAGLGGILLGYRKSVVKKMLYSSVLVVAATSLCYPNEAVDLTTNTYNKIYDKVMESWNKKTVEPSGKNTEKKAKSKASTKLEGDMGQSREEDKDMYTTRTS